MKDVWWLKKACEIQTSADKQDSKSLYQQLHAVYGPHSSVFAPLRAKTGNGLLHMPDEIKSRWRQHFSEVLNHKVTVSSTVVKKLAQRPVIYQLDEPPTEDEIKAAVKIMNTRKAPRNNGIVAETIQQGGGGVVGFSVCHL